MLPVNSTNSFGQHALDLVPGARAAQFATGRELITGSSIDRRDRNQQALAGVSLLASTGPFMLTAGIIHHREQIPPVVRTLLANDFVRASLRAGMWFAPGATAAAAVYQWWRSD